MILGIDIGTRCGVAVLDSTGTPVWVEELRLDLQDEAGARPWSTRQRKPPSLGLKALKLRTRLREILSMWPASSWEVAVEEVMMWESAYAAHTYGALLGVADEVAVTLGVELRRYAVPTIKKHATGKGNATKEAMVEAAKARWPHADRATTRLTDNMADALWIAHLQWDTFRA